jgi:hypothetical protein
LIVGNLDLGNLDLISFNLDLGPLAVVAARGGRPALAAPTPIGLAACALPFALVKVQSAGEAKSFGS